MVDAEGKILRYYVSRTLDYLCSCKQNGNKGICLPFNNKPFIT